MFRDQESVEDELKPSFMAAYSGEKRDVISLVAKEDKDHERFRIFIPTMAPYIIPCSRIATVFSQFLWRKISLDNVGYRFSRKEDEYYQKMAMVTRQLVMPLNPENKTMEDHVSGCDQTAYANFESVILKFQVPKSRRKTLNSNPFILGKEKIFEGNFGWSISSPTGE
ncbi:unnamed protein product, partial [Allacma fusca]